MKTKTPCLLSLLLSAAAMLTSIIALAQSATADPEPSEANRPVVSAPQGVLLGSVSELAPAVEVYRGIPYALPPVGRARWQAPQPAPGWSGERMATQFSPDCIQSPYPQGSFFYRPARPQSEDCLYLNVWTAARSDERRPVMVWIHGGAFTRGSGAIDAYDGAYLATKDVVVVTINYRLGVFGFLAHPELVAESQQFSAGNYAILDQIQALRWVQDNIASFGGDPDNVTIFGESAGAWGVHLLTASPLAEGLFHKAIAQSGARLDVRVELDRRSSAGSSAVAAGMEFAAALGSPTLAELRALPAHVLQSAATDLNFSSDGIVDGWVIPEQPYTLFAQGRQNAVPVLLGFNSEEGTTLGAGARVPESSEVYERQIRQQYGELSERFLEVYPADDPRQATLDAYRDSVFGWNMVTWANLTRNVDQAAYLYYFQHRPPGPDSEVLGAYHAAEIPYVFNNLHTLRSEAREEDYRLAEIMAEYWVSFARDGHPQAPSQARWQPYTNGDRHFMRFDADGAAADKDLTPENWALFDRVMDRRR